jgi:hypothetical protein
LREAFRPWSSPLPQAGYDWRDEDAHPLPLGQGWQLYQAQAPAKAVGPLERSTGGAPAEIPALMAETLSALIAHLEAHGVQPIFFLGPAGRPRDDVRSVFEAGLLPNLFAYELGTGYRLAERYNEENPSAETAPKDYFSDSLHLNEAGARIFGKWLAEDFHGFLEAQGRTAK